EEHRRRELTETLGEEGSSDVLLVRADRRRHRLPRWERAGGRTEQLAREVDVAVRRADLADVRVALESAERERERPEARLLAVDERGLPAHREWVAADEMRRVVGAAAASDVEVGERELLGALHRVRRRRRVEAAEVMRGAAGRLARGELRHRGDDRGPPRDVPRLPRVRIEPRLEEGLARESLVGDGREDPVHARARGRRADPREETERAVGSAGLLQRREDEDDPLRSIPVVDERARPKLPALLLEEDAKAPVQPDQPWQEARPARQR